MAAAVANGALRSLLRGSRGGQSLRPRAHAVAAPAVARLHSVPDHNLRAEDIHNVFRPEAQPQIVTLHFVDPNAGNKRVTVEAQVGETVVDVAKRCGIDIHAACGQKLQCATCHVIMQKAFHAKLSPPGVRENDMLETVFTAEETSRLGCQIRLTPALDGMQLTLPSKAFKGMIGMSVDQPRPKAEMKLPGIPAVAPRVSSRMQQPGPGLIPPGADPNVQVEQASEWERLYREEKARAAILEQRLQESLRAMNNGQAQGGERKGSSPGATASGGSADTEDKEKDEFEKMKDDLKATIVKLDKKKSPGFDKVVGLPDAKRVLRESILWPALGPAELFSGIRGGCRGVMLYGPPGCGKTMVARAAAAELCGIDGTEGEEQPSATFFHVRPSDVMSKFYGDSQRKILALEELAKEHSPAIVFLDEVDTLLGKRDGGQGVAEHHKGVTNALLTWMDGFDRSAERVFFIGATNRAGAIDEAALRRFGDLVEVGLPDAEQRRDLLESLVDGAKRDGHRAEVTAAELREVAVRTEGMSGDDVARLVQQAFLEVLRELPGGIHRGLSLDDVPPVAMSHFASSLQHRVRSSKDVYKSLQGK